MAVEVAPGPAPGPAEFCALHGTISSCDRVVEIVLVCVDSHGSGFR